MAKRLTTTSTAPQPAPAAVLAAMFGIRLMDDHQAAPAAPQRPRRARTTTTAPAAPQRPRRARTAPSAETAPAAPQAAPSGPTALPIDRYLAALGVDSLAALSPELAPRAHERVSSTSTAPNGEVSVGLRGNDGSLRILILAMKGTRWHVVDSMGSRPPKHVYESRKGGATAGGDWHYGKGRPNTSQVRTTKQGD